MRLTQRHSCRLLCWCFLLFPLLAIAQDYEDVTVAEDNDYLYPERVELPPPVRADFDEATWKELIEDLDYTEEKRPEPKKEIAPPPKPRPQRSGGGWQLLKFVGILLGVVALVILLLYIFGDGKALFASDKKLKGGSLQIDLDDIEEHLATTELDDYIQQAIRDGQYALAVRLYYLEILKGLSAGGALRWKRDKTNGEYLRELATHPLREDFRAATRTYERVWYGQTTVDRTAFERVQPTLAALARRVHTPQSAGA